MNDVRPPWPPATGNPGRSAVAFVDSPLGLLRLQSESGALASVEFWDSESGIEARMLPAPDPLLAEAARQLEAYFRRRLFAFDLPLAPRGTPFQREVWRALTTIPYGATLGYGELAKAIGQPKASRAVGAANSKNPIAIVVPCHRVIGKDGKLTGFAGGLERKAALLDLERLGIRPRNRRVDPTSGETVQRNT